MFPPPTPLIYPRLSIELIMPSAQSEISLWSVAGVFAVLLSSIFNALPSITNICSLVNVPYGFISLALTPFIIPAPTHLATELANQSVDFTSVYRLIFPSVEMFNNLSNTAAASARVILLSGLKLPLSSPLTIP